MISNYNSSTKKITLRDVTEKTETLDPKKFPNHPFIYIDVSAVSNKSFSIEDPTTILGKEAPSRARKVVRSKDVIFATVRPTLKRVSLINEKYDNQLCSTGFCVLRSKKECIDTNYLFFQLLTKGFIEYTRTKQRGVSYPAISDKDLLDYEFNIPDLNTQQQISNLLKTVFDAINIQREISTKLNELKKAMMHHLFTHGTKGEKTKITEIGEIPESWESASLGSLIELSQYGLSKKGNTNGSYPILRMTNQDNGHINLNNLQYVELDNIELKKFEVLKRDIIFNRTNSLELVGKTSIFDTDQKGVVFASYLIRIRTIKEKLLPEYLNYYLNFNESQKRLRELATRGVSQSNISASRLATFIVPVPPILEQEKIVSVLDAVDDRMRAGESKTRLLGNLFNHLLSHLIKD